MTFLAEAERNLTPETPDRGRGDASGKRAVTSACDDAPGELRSWAAWAWLSLSEGMPSRHQAPSASRKAISARGGGMLRPARFLSVALAFALSRLRKTPCTGSEACTTAAALNAGSEFRLLAAVGRAPDVAQGPSALRERFPGCNYAPALGVPSKISGNPFLTHTDSGHAGISVGHRRWVRQDTPALSPQPEQRPPSTPKLRSPNLSDLPPSSATRSASALPPDLPKQL